MRCRFGAIFAAMPRADFSASRYGRAIWPGLRLPSLPHSPRRIYIGHYIIDDRARAAAATIAMIAGAGRQLA